jgi:polar amino acid transport system substrate-binding protein
MTFCLVLLLGVFALALRVAYQRSPAEIGAIEIAAGLTPPDMSIGDCDDQMGDEVGCGREAEIIRSALRLGGTRIGIQNKPIRFHVEPFGKHWYSYQTEEHYDAVATVPKTLNLVGHRSDPYITYQNGIGVIADSPQRPSLQQLYGKRVVAFAGAADVIPGLADQIEHFKAYIEREDQRAHSWMLLEGQVDGVIADAMIFAEFNHRISDDMKQGHVSVQFSAKSFAPTCYTMMFKNAEYRDAFNEGLRIMIQDGQLYRIDQKYMSKIRNWDAQYLISAGRVPCDG